MVCSVVITLLLIEGAARILHGGTYTNHVDWRNSQPEPYLNSDYFSMEFRKEQEEQPGGWINPEGTRILVPKNYQGKYFNVKDNFRVTENEPNSFFNKIHLFGGSTVYNSEVPDALTIASQLQKKVNGVFPNQYKVLNYGATSINSAQQLDRLASVPIDSGDIVIFYGGVNDTHFFRTGKLDGWIVGENRAEYQALSFFDRLRVKLHKKFSKYSVFVDIYLQPYSKELPPFLKDPTKVKELEEELRKHYVKTITRANEMSKNAGAQFFNFVQPHILTRQENTAYELKLMNNEFLTHELWLKALEYGYNALASAQEDLKKNEVITNDISNLFDQSKENYYLDICHVTEDGNTLVMNKIYEKIFNHKS